VLTTSKENTELQKHSTTDYFTNRTAVVRFVKDQLQSSRPDSQLTMTIEQDASEGFYVSTAIVTS